MKIIRIIDHVEVDDWGIPPGLARAIGCDPVAPTGINRGCTIEVEYDTADELKGKREVWEIPA